jgi:hypothetical protein
MLHRVSYRLRRISGGNYFAGPLGPRHAFMLSGPFRGVLRTKGLVDEPFFAEGFDLRREGAPGCIAASGLLESPKENPG